MSSYTGQHAELYDIFYADKPYDKEATFVHQCLQRYTRGAPHHLLELACGTGSHAFEIEKYGYDVIATDYSEDMLAIAKRKGVERASSVDFRWQDMRKLDVEAKLFDGVICLFDSIGYVETNDAIKQVLEGVNRHLRLDGLFLFEFWHAAAMLRDFDPVRVRRWSTPKGTIIRISETELVCEQQLAKVNYTIYDLQNDGKYKKIEETQTNRYFLIQEMASWLLFCGFTPLKWFAGFSLNENITEQTWHIVAVARKDDNLPLEERL